MDARYKNKTIPQLRTIAVRHFHKYIRERDKDKPCISCGKYNKLQAGHFYSAGQYPGLRFEEKNVHGQCLHCNYFKHGSLINYTHNLVDRIGAYDFGQLKLKADTYKKSRFKWDRFYLLEIIEKYKKLNNDKERGN